MTDAGRIAHGRATVSWGPRIYGLPQIIANAPLSAIDDLVVAVELAASEIGDTTQLRRRIDATRQSGRGATAE